jgi:uncharacterized protein (TIGR00251 family)
VQFAVQVQPRAATEGVVGAYGDALRVRVRAPPVDHAANTSLIAVLARSLGVRERQVRIVAGAASRRKVVEVDGISPARVVALGDAAAPALGRAAGQARR